MNLQEIWPVLNIEETKDESTIKVAYRKKLATTNPEDNPQEFMVLRQAYEEALRYAKTMDSMENSEDDEFTSNSDTDLDRWMKQVDLIYQDMSQRRDVSVWDTILSHEVCTSIDQSIQAREYLLRYFMNHTYLPTDVWRRIDKEFHIREDKEQLYEIYPKNYIDYLVYSIEVDGFFDYSLFQPVEGEDMDKFLETYYQIKDSLDRSSTEGCSEGFEILKTYQSYHPYVDGEKVRYYLAINNIEDGALLLVDLYRQYPEDSYIQIISAHVKFHQKVYDEALEKYQLILKDLPKHYQVRVSIMECYERLGMHQEAKDMGMALIEEFPQDDSVSQKLFDYNEILIHQYEQKLKDTVDYPLMIELAWCYYQNHKYEEAVSYIKKIPREYQEHYDYVNLVGRAYYNLKDYHVAIDKINYWITTIEMTKRDGSKECIQRYNRLGYAYFLKGLSYLELKEYDNAIAQLNKAISVEKNLYYKLMFLERLTFTYHQMKNYSMVVEVANSILTMSSTYYPALLYRQEAYYEMGNDYEVIQDYHLATEIVPHGLRPYLFAMKVFLRHNQLDDAENVASRAREYQLSSNEFQLLEIRILRRMANSPLQIKHVEEQCIALKEKLTDPDNDIQEIHSVDYERVLLYADHGLYETAMNVIDEIIKKDPHAYYYQYIKGLLYKDNGQVAQMIHLYKKLLSLNHKNENILYEIGAGYYSLGHGGQGIPFLKECLELNPEHFDATDSLVDIYLDQYIEKEDKALYEKALHYANTMIEIRPGRYSLICRGILFMKTGELSKALADYEAAKEYEPENWAIWNNIGHVYVMQRKLDLAAENYDKAMELITMEQETLPYYNRANLYRIQRDYDKALKIYLELYEMKSKSKRLVTDISDIYMAKKDGANSREWLSKMEMDNVYRQYLADVHLMEDNEKEALAMYQKLYYNKDRNSAIPYSMLLLIKGKVKKAISVIRKSLKPTLSNKREYGELLLQYAMILWCAKLFAPKAKEKQLKYKRYRSLSKRYGKYSMKFIRKLYKDENTYFTSNLNRQSRLIHQAYYYVVMGNSNRAKEILEELLKTEYDSDYVYEFHLEAYDLYALLYLEAADYEKAKFYYEEIVRMAPASKLYALKLQHVILRMEETK